MKTTGKRILIVDDEGAIRRSLRAYLEDDGFQPFTTGSGEEGLDVLAETAFDAAIVDLRLPGMNGITFIQKAHRLCPKMGFLICTGSVGFNPTEKLSALGVEIDQIFTKPIADLSTLADAVIKLIQEKQ